VAITLAVRRRSRFDLASLQAQCALNYARLSRLLPEIRELGSRKQIALSQGGQDFGVLHFEVLEVCPWTSSVQLSHDYSGTWLHLPRLVVRLYHDLRLAEVMSTQHNRPLASRYPYPNTAMQQPDEKSQLNGFLGQCLHHCLAVGHELLPV